MDSLTNYQAGYNLINDFLINHSSTSHVSDDTDDTFRLKLRLEYFFMDPLKKWEKRKTKPWKLLVQIIKLVIFTYQLILFGSDMAKFITYQDEMQTTLKTLLLRGWQPTADAIAYPGPYVPYAVYTKQDFFDSMNFAIKAYSNVPQTSVGTFGFPNTNQSEVPPVRVCVTHLLQADFEPSQFRYNYSMFTKEDCTFIDEKSKPEIETWNQFKVENLNLIDFKKMVLVTIELPLRSLLIEDATSGDEGIVCFEVENKILYDNRHRDGQVVVDLFSLPKRFDCQGSLKESSGYLISRLVINIFVISIATLSCALCVRSLWRAFWLAKCTDLVLRTKGKALTFSDKLEFCDGWLILIIINDIMIASATAILSLYNERLLETSNYTICSLLLGVGNFLSWAGLLRYLSFFRQYNILLLTLKKSFPHVMRFMLCTMLIYCGFCFCGWIVFGPYHFKFRQLSTTTECLFALINGDDMFETFALLRSNISAIWWFSRIYLYIFVSLFIYVVLSLFIALIMDAYEVIKELSEHGFPATKLQTFYLDGDLSKFTPAT